uniref:F-box domain-containing protein n=1 Tax=Aegilops tauschii subsp. strangulata TaxID=200361 RepID=A0A452ZUM6_AEGTS
MIGSSKRKTAAAMPSRSEATKKTAEVLPSNKRKKAVISSACAPLFPDDMILEVLLRLPVKSILRFRSVCRSWAAMLPSKDFCSLHMATSKMMPPAPKLLVLSPASTFGSVAVYACSPSSPVDDLLFTFDCARRNSVEMVMPSPCCGLTLLYDAAAPAYYVCNAATRAITRLPPHRVPTYDSSAGLGFDAGTREYKVVRLINGVFGEKETIRCDVCTPGADRWRPATGGVPFKWSQFANSAVHHAAVNKIPPVFANGCLHWLINPSLIIRRPRAAIVSFSVAEETFGCVRSPPFWGPREHLGSLSQSEGEHLVVMDDQLCIVRDLRNGIPHGGTLEIWGLLDYGSGDWSLNHRIDLFGQVKRELADPRVVRVIGNVGNCKLGKKIVIATSKHLVHDKFQKKVYSYDPSRQVLEGILSVTETHTSLMLFVPGSRFSLLEESLALVHKTHEDLAFKNVLKKLRLHLIQR